MSFLLFFFVCKQRKCKQKKLKNHQKRAKIIFKKMEDTSKLNPCELGTKAYWDTAYDKEIKNYEDHGDVGEKK